jgi:hypothetical protein
MSAKIWILGATALAGLAWLGVGIRGRTPASEPMEAQATDAAVLDPVPVAGAGPDLSTTGKPLDRVPIAIAPWASTAVAIAAETSVSGRLLRPDGTPASGAYVALLRMIDGRPRDEVADQRTTGEDGAFRLVGPSGPALVVGLAEGFLPVGLTVSLVERAEVPLEPAVLAPASHIRGRLRILGTPAPKGSGLWAPHPNRGSHDLLLNGVRLEWAEERLHPKTDTVETDADGRFALEGLEPGLYAVEVGSVPGAHVLRARFEVPAPGDGVELDVDCARLVVDVRTAGQPLQVRMALNENGRGRGSVWGFGSESHLELLVPPGSPWELELEKEGYVGQRPRIVAPASGETRALEFEMERSSDGAELVIRLESPDGSPIGRAGFGFVGTDRLPGVPRWVFRRCPDGSSPSVVLDAEAEDGSFRLRDIPPGHYQVWIRTGEGWDAASDSLYHDSLEVDLAPRAVEERRVPLYAGGRLRIACHDRRGTSLGAHCEIRDAAGTAFPVTFFTRDERGSIWIGSTDLHPGTPGGMNDADRGLPPGRYEVRLSNEGYRDGLRTVEIRAGTTSEVALVLEDG